jgi:hypothetical protein
MNKNILLNLAFSLLNIILFLYYVDDFGYGSIILVLILLLIQLKYHSTYTSIVLFFISMVWLLFYYNFVFPSGDYYTAEQILTDSNYYDYHALKLSVLDFSEIIDRSNITWQSQFVISFYAIVYKVFGQNLINPILVNLIMIYLSLYFLRIRLLSNTESLLLLLLLPFFAINTVVVGKDTLTIFFMSLFLKEFYNINRKSFKKSILSFIIQINMLFLSTMNRINSLPIFLSIYITKIKKINLKTIGILIIFFILFLYLFLNQLSHYFDISSYIHMQREKSNMPDLITTLLLPTDVITYFIIAPLRMIAFLISPFPLFSNLFNFNFNDSISYFSYSFFLFKLLSGMTYFFILFYLALLIKRKNLLVNTLLPFLIVVFFISSVHLVEGGRYRVICDMLLVWTFIMSRLINMKKIRKYSE